MSFKLFQDGNLRKASDTKCLLDDNLEKLYLPWFKEELKKVVSLPHAMDIPQEFRDDAIFESIRNYVKKYNDECYCYTFSENNIKTKATLNIKKIEKIEKEDYKDIAHGRGRS
jgi:hypothetical protein